MSTIKTNNVQLGQSVTATNNFTWYQPASPDGTVRLGNGNAGSVTDLITLGSTGNLTFTGTTETYTNSVVISAASTKTLTLNGGAGSNGLVIDANNNVGIGTSSPTQKLQIAFSTADANGTLVTNTSTGNYFSISAMGTNAYGITDWQNSTVFEAVPQSAGGLVLGTYTGSIKFQTGARTTRLILDASGNLGLGVTPSGWDLSTLQTSSQVSLGGFGYSQNANYSGGWKYITTAAASRYIHTGGVHYWYTAPSGTAGNAITFTQAMTLDASGNLIVGIASVGNSARQRIYTASSSQPGLEINLDNASATGQGLIISQGNTAGSTYKLISGWSGLFGSSASETFIVYNNGNVRNTNNSYAGISDRSLKENIVDATPKLADLLKVRIRNFNLIGDSTKQIGVIAQELEEIFPGMVEEDGEGIKSVKYSVFTPMLLKAIQELSQEIETLKQRIK